MSENLSLDVLKNALVGTSAAFRCVTEYQPAGGPNDKVFPPTYEGGKYATEDRRTNGQTVKCVLLDSVQSQANRMEIALLNAQRSGKIKIPLISVHFNHDCIPRKFSVTSLEAPHRVADAVFRDSLLNGKMFRESDKGLILDSAETGNATGLFGLCPTALIFGLWDSAGPRGGLGAKFSRALVSEIVGWDAVEGVRTSSRIDPLGIVIGDEIYMRDGKTDEQPGWTLNPDEALKDKGKLQKVGKKGKPSEINHGNVTPSIKPNGGFTISKAVQTTVISLTALRRLQFPLNNGKNDSVNHAARIVLGALGLASAVLAREEGTDLRSRCQLIPVKESHWELLDKPNHSPSTYILDGKEAVEILKEAVEEAKGIGLPWEDEIVLIPSDDLLRLVQKSQELVRNRVVEDGE